ncbi:hypothetical protein ACQVTU_10675 [Bacillus cereus]|uniref:hypothetical protein n=1 Tax=Bacillus TaxID=1386 RepID=UPI0030FC44F3|nr:hypothetical protein [Bacillus cereus]
MRQLTFEDVVGSLGYTAECTAERFVSQCVAKRTYAVEFFDRDEKQRLFWFEAKSEAGAEEQAKDTFGKIQVIKVYVSKLTLQEIMELD